jgi:hypothetical protein
MKKEKLLEKSEEGGRMGRGRSRDKDSNSFKRQLHNILTICLKINYRKH